MDWTFKTPERKKNPDHSIVWEVPLQHPYVLPQPIEYDGRAFIPNIRFQTLLEPMVQTLLSTIAQTPTLFRVPPTLKSLQAITPVWGAVLQDGSLIWNPAGGALPELPKECVGRPARIEFSLEGVHITRLSILPVWGIHAFQVSSDRSSSPDRIDLDFADSTEDTRSLVSAGSIETDTAENTVFELHDVAREKREYKQNVRELLRRAAACRLEAESALEHFLEEYDLSEGESDFSDADD